MLSQTHAESLKQAINRDDLAEVRHLLTKHPELNHAPIGYGGHGPLTWAAESRGMGEPSKARLGIAEWLMNNGVGRSRRR